ncbi:MAG: hypothetical protein CVV33_06640 [Methanomicrobiales archaeon HGW-Methanomicrobiales-4]|nr:MAG: hypothetical protein CVV33_06640 [Methanomicrobiales archaeon HGW-Methanomicrobiales-4]
MMIGISFSGEYIDPRTIVDLWGVSIHLLNQGRGYGGIRAQRDEVWSLPAYSVKEMVPIG